MKTISCMLCLLALGLTDAFPAEIKRVTDGGVSVTVSELLPTGGPAVVVFHTPWDQTSITLVEEITNWSSQYSNFTVILVDAVDERSQVCRQFNLSRLPAIIIFDSSLNQVGDPLDNIDDLEDALSGAGIN